MGEIVSDCRYEEVIIQELPAGYDSVKTKSFIDHDFDQERNRRTICNIFIDNLSRVKCNYTKSVAGQGATMQATARRLGSDVCYNCVTTTPSHKDASR